MTAAMPAHHQNSLRLARPDNVAYFRNTRDTDTMIGASEYGWFSGGAGRFEGRA
jgi:hypothetical protein